MKHRVINSYVLIQISSPHLQKNKENVWGFFLLGCCFPKRKMQVRVFTLKQQTTLCTTVCTKSIRHKQNNLKQVQYTEI